MDSGRTLRSFLSVRKRTLNDGQQTKQKEVANELHSLKKTRSESDLSSASTPATVTPTRYSTRTSSLRTKQSTIIDSGRVKTSKVTPVATTKRKPTLKEKSSTPVDRHANDQSVVRSTDSELAIAKDNSDKSSNDTASQESDVAAIALEKSSNVNDKHDNANEDTKKEQEDNANESDDTLVPVVKEKPAVSVSDDETATVTSADTVSELTSTSSTTTTVATTTSNTAVDEEDKIVAPPQLISDKPKTFSAANASSIPRPSTHLAQYTPLLQKTSVALPDHYEVLLKILAALDHTILFMRGQRQRSIYHKIRASVEEMCRRQFELRHLAQLKTVYPEAYVFESASVVVNGERQPSIIIDIPSTSTSTTTSNTDQLLARDQLTRRRDQLRDRLVALLRKHHQVFITTNTKCKQQQQEAFALGDEEWHPDFDLHSVAEIELAPLPLPTQVPIAKVRRLQLFGRKKPSTIDEMKSKLATVSTSLTSNKQKEKEKEKEEEGASKSVEKPTTTPIPSASKGVAARAAALLDRIRQKSKQRGSLTLAEESAQSRQKALNSRLPSVVDALAFMSSSLGKRVLPLKDVARRLANSTEDSLISEGEAYELVKRFTETAPRWCALITTGGVAYIRIHRPLDTAQIKEELRQTTTQDTTATSSST